MLPEIVNSLIIFLILKMASVKSRNVECNKYFTTKAAVLFYSRIVLRKMNEQALSVFRLLEKSCKTSSNIEG